ncbi:MAG: DUF308 domain-containing protein [Lachnospiraceae bacterium]|nr:hypothetical protein [Sarcina sp.]MBR2729669.1 DUF308 domain-containing protein [Lachnospiraceae bacterium]
MRNLSGSRKIYAFGSLILGLVLLLWPGSALRMVAYAAGIVIMAGGITAILAHFRDRTRTPFGGINLAVGVVVTLVGGWIFLNPERFASVIPTAVGYLIVFSGIVNLLETFSLSKAHYRKWWVSLLAAVGTIFMGLFLINHAFGVASTMVRFGGAFLLFNGISDLWINRRVDQYVRYKRRGSSGGRSASAAGSAYSQGSASARHDTSGPDIIDADDYREL